MRILIYVLGTFIIGMVVLFVLFAFIHNFILGRYYRVIERLEESRIKREVDKKFTVFEKNFYKTLSSNNIGFKARYELNDMLDVAKIAFKDERFSQRVNIMQVNLLMYSKNTPHA